MALTFQEASKIATSRAQESGTPLTGSETEADIFKLAGQGLPDVSPVTGGIGSDLATLKDLGLLPDQGTFASSVDILEQQKREARGRATTAAQRRFDVPIAEATRERELIRGGATAAATRFAGGLGLDTATQGFIQSQVDVGEKRISGLKKDRDIAIAKADTDAADRFDKLIIAENERIDKLRQQTFTNLLALGTARRAEAATALAADKFGLDVTKFADGQDRFERTQGLAEIKEFRIASKEQRDKLLADITRLAESGISLDQISDEDKTKFEIAAELPEGSFEAFYQKLFDDAAQGDILDQLKIDKVKADIANVFSTISQRGVTTDMKNFAAAGGEEGTGMTFAEFLQKGGVSSVTLFDSVMQAAINEGASASDAALAAATVAENTGITLTKEERANLINRASNLTPTVVEGESPFAGTGEPLTIGSITGDISQSEDDLARAKAKQNAINAGLTTYLDPITNEVKSVTGETIDTGNFFGNLFGEK